MTTPNHENIDYWLFDWIEGNLNADQEMLLREFIELNPEYEMDADSWKESKLVFPELDDSIEIQIPEKKKRRFALLWWSTPIISILFLGSFFFMNSLKSNGNKISKVSNQMQNSEMNQDGQKSNKANSSSYANSWNSKKLTDNKPFIGHNLNLNLVGLELIKQFHSEDNSINNHGQAHSNKKLDKILLSQICNPLALLQHGELSLSTLNIPAEDNEHINKEPKVGFQLPSLNLSKNTVIGKFLLKDVTSKIQKDRMYAISEKSHLDLNQGLVGNLSQSKFQSTSFIRWFDDQSNQKLSQQISFDTYIRQAKSGVGVLVNYADFGNGTIKDWNLNLIFSPKIALSRFVTMEPSVSYQFGKKSLDINKVNNYGCFAFQSNQLQTYNYDMTLPVGEQLWYRDITAGLMLNLGPIYLGGQASNLLQHQDNINTNNYSNIGRASSVYSFIAGTDFKAKKEAYIFSPMVFHERIANNSVTQFGATLQLKNIVLGGNYATNNNITAMAGFNSEKFTLLVQSTKMQNITNQKQAFVHQLTLRINSNISRKSRRYLYL